MRGCIASGCQQAPLATWAASRTVERAAPSLDSICFRLVPRSPLMYFRSAVLSRQFSHLRSALRDHVVDTQADKHCQLAVSTSQDYKELVTSNRINHSFKKKKKL